MLVGQCGFCLGGIFRLDQCKGKGPRIAFHGNCVGNGSIPAAIHEVETYKYRSLPCTAGDWSVCGSDTLNGAGVLEWCFDEADAKERLQIMKSYPQFQDLSIGSPEETKIPVYEWCSGNIRPVSRPVRLIRRLVFDLIHSHLGKKSPWLNNGPWHDI